MLLFASGYTVKMTAAVIGCDTKTLRKVFPVEVRERDRAALVLRTGMMARLLEEAEAGSVAASKELDRMIDRERGRVAEDRVKTRTSEPVQPKVGKKEAADIAAREHGGKFRTRQAPPDLLN